MAGFFSKITGVFKRPPVYWTLLIILASVLVAGLMFFIFGRWLDAILIAVALGLIGVLLLVLRSFLAMEREDRLARGIDAGGAAPAGPGQAGESVELGFRRAIEEIRSSRLGAGGLDALPWILVLGEPGAGKTAAIRESQLAMPAEYATRVGGGPTSSCDWWLTNHAIVLDLAGRYLEQEDEASQAEWRALLRLMRRSRSGVAANGMIFAVSVESLLGQSSGELEDRARSLRRRINEATDELGVDLPIYVLVTKVDQVEGFVEAIAASPVIRPDSAFGWTNDQRVLPDPEQPVIDGLAGVIGRLEGVMPELLLREPDLVRRRRIFALPHELEHVVAAVAKFVGRAFGQTPYDAPPFLRGVYLASARREGHTVSPQLHRLGQDWARHSVQGSLNPGGFFLHDLLLEIIVGDRDLALPMDRFGQRARLALNFAMGGMAALLILWWTISFASNLMGIRRIASEAGAVIGGSTSLAALDGLRASLVEEAADIRVVRRGGLAAPMETALARGRTTYVWAFGREFESLAKRKITSVVTGFDDGAFEALAQLATDVTWLAARGDPEVAARPDLARHAPITGNASDVEAFDRGYEAWVHWSPVAELQSAIDRESDAVASAASRLLELQRLEAWARGSRAHPSIGYAYFGLPGAEAVDTTVSGAFSRKAWEGLVVRLLDAIESSGKASDRARTFRDTYVVRFDEQWRTLLLDTPIPISPHADIKSSPYLAFVEALHFNTLAEMPRRDPVPDWILSLREARRDAPLPGASAEPPAGADAPPPPQPPWLAYQAALALVAADTEVATQDGEVALALCTQMADRKSTSFDKAYRLAAVIVPDGTDASASRQLEALLQAPVLDAASAVIARAFENLEALWQAKVVGPSRDRLTAGQLRGLYAPGGAIDEIVKGPLAPFFRNGKPVMLIGNRGMPFGPGFLRWMESAGRLQRVFAGSAMGGDGKLVIRMKGLPARIRGGKNLRVSGVELRLRCDDGTQSFDYRMGSRPFTLRWSPDCVDLSVRVSVLDGARQRELTPAKEWKGPMAFPLFMQEATQSGDVLQWRLSYPEQGVDVEVGFEMSEGLELRGMRHVDPPSSMAR